LLAIEGGIGLNAHEHGDPVETIHRDGAFSG